MTIRLRPHHLINHVNRYQLWRKQEHGKEDLELYLQDIKKDYGEDFAALDLQIFDGLLDNPDLDVVVTETWDDLCGVCAKRRDCTYGSEDQRQMRFLDRLGIPIGVSLKSGYIVDTITAYMDDFFARQGRDT